MAGLWFEQFEVGQVIKHEIRRTVLEYENMLFSSLTYNPARSISTMIMQPPRNMAGRW